jgi:uncharacterized protein
MRLRFKLFILLLLILVSFAPPISAAVRVPPQPPNYVVDLANIIDSNAETSLNAYLKELERKTSAQVVVLTVTSLDGESIEDFSISLAHDKWKLGQKGKDNGMLLLVAIQDRKYRFEVGYGLEAILPDSLVGSIGRQYLVPYFKKGDFSTGILTSTLAVINIIATDAGVTLGDLPRMEVRRDNRNVEAQELTPMGKLFSLLFIVAMIYFFIKHPRLAFFLLLMSMSGGGRRGGWSGGGGFGGGGGGGFGGGGASGGW